MLLSLFISESTLVNYDRKINGKEEDKECMSSRSTMIAFSYNSY